MRLIQGAHVVSVEIKALAAGTVRQALTPSRTRVSPGRASTVTDMAETDTKTGELEPTDLPPKELVSEIERTRANLARTIDEITDRVSPANVARRATDQVKGRLSQVDPLIGGAVALAAVSVTCYLLWRRLRK